MNHRIRVFALLALCSLFFFPGCVDCGSTSDDSDDDTIAVDDDASPADNDSSPGDDDASPGDGDDDDNDDDDDDDDNDDTTTPDPVLLTPLDDFVFIDSDDFRLEMIDGGAPGHGHLSSVGLPGGNVLTAAIKGRSLVLYESDPEARETVATTLAHFAGSAALAIDDAGTVYLAYFNLLSGWIMVGTQTPDGWLMYPAYRAVTTGQWLGPRMFMLAAPDSTLHLVHQSDEGIRHTHGQGADWSSQRIHRLTGTPTQIVLDERGAMHVAAEDGTSVNYANNGIGVWGIMDGVCSNCRGGGLARRNGKTYVAYYDRASHQVEIARHDALYTWTLQQPVEIDGPATEVVAGFGIDGKLRLAIAMPEAGYMGYAVGDLTTDWEVTAMSYEEPANVQLVSVLPYTIIVYYDANYGVPKIAHDGESWRRLRLDTVGDRGAYVDTAVGTDGAIHATYSDLSGHGLTYAAYRDGAWTRELIHLGNYDYHERETAIAVDASGAPHIVLVDDLDNALVYFTPDGDDWPPREDIVTGYDYAPQWPSIAMDAAGHAHVAFGDGTHLHSAQYATNAGGPWAVEPLQAGFGKTCQTDLLLDDAGRPQIAFFLYDSGWKKGPMWPKGFLQFAERDAAGTGWDIATIDGYTTGYGPSTDVGRGPSLARGPSGALEVSYANLLGAVGLKTAVQTDEGWAPRVVFLPAQIAHTSLAVDTAGRRFAAFFEYGADFLRIAHNQDGRWRTTMIDHGGLLGPYVSLNVDADGRIDLLYYGEGALWHATFSRELLLD
jgi:hypothetical protein